MCINEFINCNYLTHVAAVLTQTMMQVYAVEKSYTSAHISTLSGPTPPSTCMLMSGYRLRKNFTYNTKQSMKR